MNFKRLLLFLAAPLALVMSSCEPEGPVYTTPSISITDADGAEVTAVNFSAEEGSATITITATRGWSISKQATWLGVTPSTHTNDTMEEQSVDVKITVGPNDGDPRTETLKVVMDKIEKNITVAQAGEGQTVLGDDLYYDNFDKTSAKTDASGYWPYMSAEYGNPTPENQSGVTYASNNVTVRNNSNSNGDFSDCKDVASGVNNIFFGKTPNYLTINGISLAELEGNALTMTFVTEKYSKDNGSTFTESEFHVYISGDGAKWSEIDYTFAGTADGRWNVATAQFNLKEVPESVSLAFIVDVASSYRLDDVKLTAGGGGAEIDLSQGEALDIEAGGGNQGGATEPDPNAEQITVAEFIERADTATTYQLTGTISGNINTTYGNFDLVDESGSIYIYGLKDASGANVNWSAKGLNKGDVITVQGKYFFYAEGNKHEIKDALYISHTDGEDEGGSDTPIVAEGAYASDAAFVCATDDSTNAAYGLGATTLNGNAATGFKLGKSKQEGKFTSKAIGVEGDKYLNFYAVSWGAGGDKTIYFRVNGGEVISQDIKADSGAANNAPYNDITPDATDLYSVKLTGLSASDVIEFSTNAAFDCAATSDYATRAIFFGVKLTDEPVGEGGGNQGGEEPDPEDPEDPETPEEPTVATIASIVALGEGATVAEGTFVEGVVISNSELNNLTSKKGLYIQDETAGLQFYCGANHSFKFGDKVKVDLSGQKIATYNGAVQISGTALDKFEVLSSGNAVEAKTVTMADFLANKYEGQYIALEGVQVVDADLAKTWVVGGKHTSVNMEDAEGNAFVVFSSSYASYGANTVAQGSGTIKGISSINNGTMQIIFAQATDYAGLTGERFGDDNTGEEPEDPEEPTIAKLTIAEFLAKEKDENVWYELTGVVKNIVNTTYGNFDLVDANGDKVYVYGLTATKVSSNDKSFSSLGIVDGDTITLIGVRDDYKGTAQVNGPAYLVSHEVNNTPRIISLSQTSLSYTADGGEKTVQVTTAGEGGTLAATTAAEWLTVSAADGVVTVVAAANEGEAREAEVTVTFGEDSVVVAVAQAAKPAGGAVENGKADFETISATNTQYSSGSTTAGWSYANCAVFKGGTSDNSPAFVMIGEESNRALCMNGKTSAVGTITSPDLTTGCGTLMFNYGLPFSDTKIKFRVDIMQNGAVVDTFTIENLSATKLTAYSHEEVVNVAGEFKIVFTNLSPSNSSSSNKDRTAIWNVEWTGYAE